MPASVLKSTKARDANRLEHDFHGFRAAKMGLPVEMEDAEHLALRLFRNAQASTACGECYLCCKEVPEDTGSDWDKDENCPIPRHMGRKSACRNIREPACRCLRREALMAMAVGKEGSRAWISGNRAVGMTVQVRHMHIHCPIAASRCEFLAHATVWNYHHAWVQVYHFVGATKECSLSLMEPEPVPEGAAELGEEIPPDDSNDEEDENIPGEDIADTCVNHQDGARAQQYELLTPVRKGAFFEGVIKRFDPRAQAVYVIFKDHDKGWFQLWRSGEHVRLSGISQ
jgi:hypothetical protein